MKLSEHLLDKNLMILASAGSGKTYQLGNRIIGMIGAKEVDPERMVALTFTRKAAGEFADSVLTKLAAGTLDEADAREIQEAVDGEFDVVEVLESVVRVLPRFQLGTIDSFFSQIVRGFQYELGLSGGTFELIEGRKQDLVMGELIHGVLSEVLETEEGDEFVQAFRRATMGKEELRVIKDLEQFLKSWHGLWKAGLSIEHFRGNGRFDHLPQVDEWEKQKLGLVQELSDEFEGFDGWTHGSQEKGVIKLLEDFKNHTTGSGVLTAAGKLFETLIEAVAAGGVLEIEYYRKPLKFSENQSKLLKELVLLAASCELVSAIERSEGVGFLVKRIDEECERQMRSRGMLGFDDVKNLLGRWKNNEEARLQREQIDFRLDGCYDHWFLDEFQDTSPTEWDGLEPLITEAASEGEGSLFIVGDKKQAIYGWRGGDVRLFDQVKDHFGSGMTAVPMDKSYRSSPEVLALVNEVCGNLDLIGRLFGEKVAARWDWHDHESAKTSMPGEARVETVEKEEMMERLVETLKEVGVGEKKLACGILVRTGKQVTDISDHLRKEGFDVIEEGRRKPMEDCAVGAAVMMLAERLADPVNPFAREAVAMSPINAVIQHRFKDGERSPWEDLLDEAREEGFAMMIERLVEPLRESLSEFGRRRLGDILRSVEEFDYSGNNTPRALRDWLAGLEISQAPGDAAVQVMTIHKSKGLGFDMVVLPNLNDEQVPDRAKYEVAKAPGEWVLQTPASWVRSLFPPLVDAEERWEEEQRYEALCLLYVALTRAKQGLYVFLPRESKSRGKAAADWSSMANVVRQSVGDYQSAPGEWPKCVEPREVKEFPKLPALGDAVPLRERTTPSKLKSSGAGFRGGAGAAVGLEVHQLFESIAWLGEGEKPETPQNLAGMIVDHALAVPEIRAIFSEQDQVTLYREQAFEVMVSGKWMSGVIDRMHVGPEGVCIYDYKTDMAEDADSLRTKYEGQMKAYREAMGSVMRVPAESVRVYLVSTHLKTLIEA